MAKDSRGVLRGRCSLCTCVQYTRLESDLCSGCHHPPAKHLKLDPISVYTAGQSVDATINLQQQFTGASHPAPSHYTSPRAMGVQYSTAHYTSPSPRAVGVQYSTAYSAPILKKCAANFCFKDVHYDSELGPFDYCSPECRDRHLLPLEQERLRSDIKKNSEKMAVCLPSTSTPSAATGTATAVTDEGEKKKMAGTATAVTDEGKKKKMVTIEKRRGETLGIITAKLPGEAGLRIVGVELKTSGYHELKEGNIKLLDIITQLNEDDIISGTELLEQKTINKTKPQFTLTRSSKAPSIKNLLSKVKEKSVMATHIRVVLTPFHFDLGSDFGFEPVSTTNAKGEITGMVIGVHEENNSSAHLSGVTLRDEILMYASMNSKLITEAKIATSASVMKSDMKRALNDGKHFILVLKRHTIG